MSIQMSSIAGFLSRSNVARKGAVDLWADCEQVIPEIPSQFYAGLRSTDEFRDVIASGGQVERLKSAQAEHWKMLFQPVVAPGLEQRSARIGEVHVKIGLPSGWYMAGYAFLLKKLLPHLARIHRFSRNAHQAAVDVLIERVFTDMILSNSAYEDRVNSNRAKSATEEKNLNMLSSAALMGADANETAIELAHLTLNTARVNENSQTISAAATELVNSVEEIARHAEGAVSEVTEVDHAVRFGRKAMEEVASAIANISSAVEQTGASVDGLSVASEQIGQFWPSSRGSQNRPTCLRSTPRSRRRGPARAGRVSRSSLPK